MNLKKNIYSQLLRSLCPDSINHMILCCTLLTATMARSSHISQNNQNKPFYFILSITVVIPCSWKNKTKYSLLNWTVHPKIKILASFTHPSVVPNFFWVNYAFKTLVRLRWEATISTIQFNTAIQQRNYFSHQRYKHQKLFAAAREKSAGLCDPSLPHSFCPNVGLHFPQGQLPPSKEFS